MTALHDSAPQPLASRVPRRRQLIGLTPLIDVVFILLIFFMLASNLQRWQSITLDAPAEASGVALGEKQSVLIDVYEDEITMDGEAMTLDEALPIITARLEREADLAVLIRPVAEVTLQRAVRVLDGMTKAGATNVSLVNAGGV